MSRGNRRLSSEGYRHDPQLAWCNLPNGSNEFLNKRWHDYTGISAEEAHGWGWKVAIHPEDLPMLTRKWEALRHSDKPGECEVPLRRFDGAFRSFLCRVEPLRYETAKVSDGMGRQPTSKIASGQRTLRLARSDFSKW